MTKLNSARSRLRSPIWSFVLIDQTWLGRRGRLCPDKLAFVPRRAVRWPVIMFVFAVHGLSPCSRDRPACSCADPRSVFRDRSRGNSSFGRLPTVDFDPQHRLTDDRYQTTATNGGSRAFFRRSVPASSRCRIEEFRQSTLTQLTSAAEGGASGPIGEYWSCEIHSQT